MKQTFGLGLLYRRFVIKISVYFRHTFTAKCLHLEKDKNSILYVKIRMHKHHCVSFVDVFDVSAILLHRVFKRRHQISDAHRYRSAHCLARFDTPLLSTLFSNPCRLWFYSTSYAQIPVAVVQGVMAQLGVMNLTKVVMMHLSTCASDSAFADHCAHLQLYLLTYLLKTC